MKGAALYLPCMENCILNMVIISSSPVVRCIKYILTPTAIDCSMLKSFTPIFTPARYRNQFGQLLEHSPFCERDIVRPSNLKTYNEQGAFDIFIKKRGMMFPYQYANHPFDVVGWDGYHYPYIFSIFNFEPITGRIHMPPPIHQTFENAQFVICSFVPRLYDYHPASDSCPLPS
jgi:homogentisate 1,2-dioxygenase